MEDGFYDGLIFHQVIPGFMIQSGDSEESGMDDPVYAISVKNDGLSVQNAIYRNRNSGIYPYKLKFKP
ncbi:peptidylprolyl isomerase [Pseudogracilibacillus sp. SO30301A]|uniref:peptidylprolyl isomerase n=1 Tax=Pseudogracilibacillus sp. SO30301A TaxID=3098291 RepID=UPI003FA7AEAF